MTSYDMEIYNITPERNMACYMMSRAPDSRTQALGVDTFKFEPLSHSASKGFTVRIPGRESSATLNDEDFRWDPEHGYVFEDEPHYGDQNPSMRNTVTLNPLHYPQNTACVYDLNELSRTGDESAYAPGKDWEQKTNDLYPNEQSPTRVVRVVAHSGLHEPIPRSENKLRSLKRLKQLSLEEKTTRQNPED